MANRRVVVTGMGICSSLGMEVDSFYRNLLLGKSGVSLITSFNTEDFPTKIAGEIKDFSTEGWIEKKQARRVDKSIAYILVTGKKALKMARLEEEYLAQLDKSRCGVLIGSGMGGMHTFVDNTLTLHEKGPKKVSPFFIPYVLTNMGGALLANECGFMGPNYSISTACATGNHAIIAAANHIFQNQADLMICGGAEAPILPVGLAGFCAIKALSQKNEFPQKASSPWDRKRDGFVMGEGAGVLILESLEHALKRGAPIFAEYLGGGISCDAHHMTEPRPDGLGIIHSIKAALAQAKLEPDEINYINAHATSTPAGDMVEVNALQKFFKNPESMTMNSTKSLLGHALGAASAIEAIVTVKAIAEKQVHPTLNLEDPEPELRFHIPLKQETLKIKAALSNAFGFGGHNAAVIFTPYA